MSYKRHLHTIFEDIKLNKPYNFAYLSSLMPEEGKSWTISRRLLNHARSHEGLVTIKGSRTTVKGEQLLAWLKRKIKTPHGMGGYSKTN